MRNDNLTEPFHNIIPLLQIQTKKYKEHEKD